MKEYRLDFVRKSNDNGGSGHITHAGNSVGIWELSVADIIRRIEVGQERFYVQDNQTNKRAYIGVVNDYGRKYIRTHADGYWNDNLLSLPVLPLPIKSYQSY